MQRLQRRVAGYHDIRLDGISDLLLRARGAAVLDVGCNRGLVGFEFANNGARLVHGCDNYEDGINTARHLFIDMRGVESKFEVVDLSQGQIAMRPFGPGQYDMILMLATYHKIKRIMSAILLQELMVYYGRSCTKYFAWRGTSDKHQENEREMHDLDRDLGETGMKRIHTSMISDELGLAAIWKR